MKNLSRVVWSEGMYLGPHHFQAQNRYFEDSIQFAANALAFCPWGLSGLQINAEALQNGAIDVVHARGLFPDGLAFDMPECDPLPKPRQIADLIPPTRDSVTAMLAIAPRRPDAVNCVPEDAGAQEAVRFAAHSRTLHDETNGRDEKSVHLGRKNIEILLDTEIPEASDLILLPLARIERRGAGFAFDPEFIPPCVAIRASERLMFVLRRLIEILEEKSSAFAARPKQEKKNWAEFSTRDIAAFWFLHTVNSALAPLRHAYLTTRGHPEELYAGMLRLAGGLATFAFDSHPRELPLYDHLHLDKCFGDLDLFIRRHLETIVPSQYLTIPLVQRADYFYEAEITDQRVLDRSRWVFAVRSPIGEVEIIKRTPQLVKLCSKDFVPQLVKRALPGLAMTHLPVPPPQIPGKIDFQYFAVAKAGPCWDHLVQTRKVGLYVPGDIPSPEIELLVILES